MLLIEETTKFVSFGFLFWTNPVLLVFYGSRESDRARERELMVRLPEIFIEIYLYTKIICINV